MRSAVVLFPGSNRERDMATAIAKTTGHQPLLVWHGDTTMPPVDLIVLPGGFSYGDYLRCGAIAARSPIMREVVKRGLDGVTILGVCNGFQILTEVGLLPGALMRNAQLRFICKRVHLRIDNKDTAFTRLYQTGAVVGCPIAHGDGNYFADQGTLDRLEGENRVVLRYCDAFGNLSEAANVNGSQRHIAGIVNEKGNILGMMPHPENFIEPVHGGSDCRAFFESLLHAA